MPCKKFQKYNPKTKSWVKYKKMKNGKTEILNVKEKEPKKPFKGITKK